MATEPGADGPPRWFRSPATVHDPDAWFRLAATRPFARSVGACYFPSPVAGGAIVTTYASIASAVRAVKLGVGGYLVKPARGDQVLRAAGYPAPGDAADVAALRDGSQPYLSLDRAIWEFLTQAVEDAGTLSGAARLLGLHARSLGCMLAKYPPPR
jgi:hypothetical protein